jgi:hypothetical protein
MPFCEPVTAAFIKAFGKFKEPGKNQKYFPFFALSQGRRALRRLCS